MSNYFRVGKVCVYIALHKDLICVPNECSIPRTPNKNRIILTIPTGMVISECLMYLFGTLVVNGIVYCIMLYKLKNRYLLL